MSEIGELCPNTLGYLTATLADIEVLTDGCDTATDPTHCAGPSNAGYWYFDQSHEAENVQVIDGFMATVCSAGGYCEDGAYTSTSNWADITGFVGPDSIDNVQLIQIASWDVSAATIQQQETEFLSAHFTMYSWQYNVANGAGTGCVYADPTNAGATSIADNVAPPIPRIDIWADSMVNIVC